MTRSRFYAAAMPIWAIVYVIVLVLSHNGTFAAVGALVFALIGVIGATVIRPGPSEGRARGRHIGR